MLVLGGGGSQEQLQARQHAGGPNAGASKGGDLSCVEDVDEVVQCARDKEETRVEVHRVLGNTRVQRCELQEE